MNIIETKLKEVKIIEPKVFDDERGYFFESYHVNKYSEEGIDLNFVQDNVSSSCKNTIRGLHYQVGTFAQGKLCQVLFGKVIDIAVDIRFGSPMFGEYVAVELSDKNNKQIWIPPGFAHGFSVISDRAVFSYKCTALYNKASERAIRYDDKKLNIDWKVSEPKVSEKDLLAPRFDEIESEFIYRENEI